MAEHTADAQRIRQVAGQCLKRVPLDRRLRLLGVRVGSLVRQSDLALGGDSEPNQALPLFQ